MSTVQKFVHDPRFYLRIKQLSLKTELKRVVQKECEIPDFADACRFLNTCTAEAITELVPVEVLLGEHGISTLSAAFSKHFERELTTMLGARARLERERCVKEAANADPS